MTRQIIYQGKKIQLALDTTMLADGTPLQREVVVHPGAVVMLPLLDDGRVCLIHNQRVAIGKRLLELPAGMLQSPEPPATAAVRELEEETGYRAAEWRLLAEFYPSPGIMTERMYLYLARGLTAGPTRLEVGEEIETRLIPWDDAVAGVLSGTICDAKTIVGILLWDRLRNRST